MLDFLASAKLFERLAELGTSCPDHFLRTKVKPLVLDLPATASVDECVARLAELHEAYRADYAAYYERHATPDSPAMRGADPAIILVPGVGMFSFGPDKQTARVAGEFYVNAINVMRGAEALSTYAPISEAEKFRIEYWALEEAKLRRLPDAEVATPGASPSSPAPPAASAGPSPPAWRPTAPASSSPTSTSPTAEAAAAELGGPDVAVGVAADVTDAAAVRGRRRRRAPRLRRHRPGRQQRRALDLQAAARDHRGRLGPPARRDGQGQLPRGAGRGAGHDRPAPRRRHRLHLRPRTRVFAGPTNVAYGAAKADQAHQVRLLAAELGEHGIRVNGVNPDGVVRGSGIFAGGWGAQRAAVYGVPEEELGAFYAQRTLLKREVLPEHVANAVVAL